MEVSAQEPTKLDRQAKTSLAVLLIFGLLVLLYGWGKISDAIRSPFAPANTAVSVASASTDANQDSDKDGLTDQEEADIYGTSAYQPDTDGDKQTDSQEILNGTDPLCPEGQNCGKGTAASINAAANSNSAAAVNSAATNVNANTAPVNASGVISDSTNANVATASGTPTPAEIRTLLQEAGISPQLLTKATDQQLVELYAQAAEQLGNNGALDLAENATQSSTAGVTVAQVQAMSGTDLRSYLKAAGFTDTDLQDFTDEELRTLVVESLQQVQ